jgi:hypothetical protein
MFNSFKKKQLMKSQQKIKFTINTGGSKRNEGSSRHGPAIPRPTITPDQSKSRGWNPRNFMDIATL